MLAALTSLDTSLGTLCFSLSLVAIVFTLFPLFELPLPPRPVSAPDPPAVVAGEGASAASDRPPPAFLRWPHRARPVGGGSRPNLPRSSPEPPVHVPCRP